MSLPDPRLLSPAGRAEAAWRARQLADIEPWPELAWFNSAPCPAHAPDIAPWCGACGLRPRRHQRTGAAWMFLAMRTLLADPVGPQPLDAKVLTPGGWAEMGSLAPGTQVVDPDGSLSQVAEVIPQGVQDVYRVTFSDGTSAESTLGHLWEVRGGLDKRASQAWQVRALDEICRSRRGQAVPLVRKAPDLAVPDRFLPVDPYLLGLLLGDGSLSTGTPTFGSADPELLAAAEKLFPEGWAWGASQYRAGCEWRALTGSQPLLRQLGVFGKRSWEKSVPEIYKWSSAAARLAVLQGLLDTDGHWAGCAGAEFSSASPALAAGAAWLGRSLGLRTSKVRVKKSSYRDKKTGQLVRCRDAYRVTIAPAPGMELFRLERKRRPPPRQRQHGDLANAGKRSRWARDQRVKWVRSVEYSRTVPVQCIRVTAPSGLYVTDDWTVTHNSGKSLQVALVLAMCKETGELAPGNRAVIVTRAAAVRDPWAATLRRLLPGVPAVVADGRPGQRERAYLAPWEVAVVSDRTFAHAGKGAAARDGDVEILRQFPVGIVIYDDLDPMGSRETAIAADVRRLAAAAGRVHGAHGTPLNKRLAKLYGQLEPAGGARVLGTPAQFGQRFVARKKTEVWVPVGTAFPAEKEDWARRNGYAGWAGLQAAAAADRAAGRTGRLAARALTLVTDVAAGRKRLPRAVWKDTGANPDRLPEFRRLIDPLVLRRTAADLDDVELPDVQVSPVWLDLLPAQRKRYDELRRGTLTRLRAGGEVEVTEASAVFTRGAQICSGLAALDDGNDVSAKLDYAVHLITGDLEDEKVVVYVHFRENVAALSRRLDAAGVGHVKFWSAETGAALREARRQAFITDPGCRVLIGTTTIEMSLNLQAARHLIAVDTIMNAARMEQLVGRLRRQGAWFDTMWLHHLLALGTQEDAYPDLLRAEAEMSDAVWGGSGAIFTAAGLTPRQQLSLVATGSPGQPG